MSTAPVSYGAGATATLARQLSRRRPKVPATVGAGLMLVVLYAAFEHGAVGAAREARIQIVVAGLAVLAMTAWQWSGTMSFAVSRRAATGIALLAGFAIWSGISLAWSVAPDQTWLSLNRALTYLLVLGLATSIGASVQSPIELVARGFVVVSAVVTVYALGQKMVPGLHIPGVFDLNLTGPLPRLQEPFGYWNALALFVLMAVPMVLAQAVDVRNSMRVRIGALCLIELMVLVIAFSYSRGGLLALAVGLAVYLGVGRTRLRSLMWLALVVVATLPPLLFGLLDGSLTKAGVSLGSREVAGAELGGILVVMLAALGFTAARVAKREHEVHLSRERARAIGRLLVAAVGLAAVGGLIALAVSSRGLTGSISHAWTTFTTTREASATNASRLLSADSANRWVWWKEAVGAFGDRPLGGWGAGSFPVVHLLYRQNRLLVQQPHSVPLQFLAETGVIGALLAIGAVVLLVSAAWRRVRSLPDGTERLLGGAVLGAAVAYAVHTCYDWDWDIPAMTLPAMVFLGVLVGRPGSTTTLRKGAGARVLVLAVSTFLLCAFAASAAVPSLTASKATSALLSAANGTKASLADAQTTARVASDLDPLSDAGLTVQATIATRRGQFVLARSDLLAAVGRNPSDTQAWQSLALVNIVLGDDRGAARAAERLLALDPHKPGNWFLALTAQARLTLAESPPADSATAVETPLG